MSRIGGTKNQISTRTHQHYSFPFVGDGAKTTFYLSKTIAKVADVTVKVAGAQKVVSDRGHANDYAVRGLTAGYPGDRNAIKFTAAPGNGAAIIIDLVSV